MIFGMSYARASVYALLVVGLLLTNIWWGGWSKDAASNGQSNAVATIDTKIPELELQDRFVPQDNSPTRDLFAKVEPRVVTPPKPAVSIEKPAAVDPQKIAREAAQKTFDAVTILGVIGAGGSPTAIVEFDGSVKSLSVGQELATGFRIVDLTLNYLVLRNDKLSMQQVYRIGQ